MTTVHQTSRHTAPFQTTHRPAAHKARVAALLVTAAVLSGCSDGALDLDLRGKIGNVFSTSDAARAAQAGRPDPDDRGIISYPNYQVAVARTGDTLTTVATRVGLPVDEVARYNGMKPNATLRAGEVIALPRRVAEPSPATGATGQGPIRPVSQVDITEIASVAIDNSPATPVATQQQTAATAPLVGREPIRHQVERGETAYSLSRRFGISVDTLAQWNGLDDTYTLRAGQYLLIPAADNAATQLRAPSAIVIEPGQNSITPPPPSAQSPLPTETTRPVSEADAEAEAAARAAAPALATSKPARTSELLPPVDGTIIRDYIKGRTDGIYLSAAAGTPIRAAADGVVGAVTSDQRNQTAIIIKHDDNLLTAYANVGDLAIKKGDRVKRGQKLGVMRAGQPPFMDFRVYRGSDSVDPTPFIK